MVSSSYSIFTYTDTPYRCMLAHSPLRDTHAIRDTHTEEEDGIIPLTFLGATRASKGFL
jgi:hypothetical protein